MIYQSADLSWSISLMGQWCPQESKKDPAGSFVRFIVPGKNAQHLTWMRTIRPVDGAVVEAFGIATMLAGAVSCDEALAVIQRIWPPAGALSSAAVAELPGGKIALETIEEIELGVDGKPLRAYQLLMPIDHSGDGHFQRLYFYAPVEEFAQGLAEVMEMAHSLRSGERVPVLAEPAPAFLSFVD